MHDVRSLRYCLRSAHSRKSVSINAAFIVIVTTTIWPASVLLFFLFAVFSRSHFAILPVVKQHQIYDCKIVIIMNWLRAMPDGEILDENTRNERTRDGCCRWAAIVCVHGICIWVRDRRMIGGHSETVVTVPGNWRTLMFIQCGLPLNRDSITQFRTAL